MKLLLFILLLANFTLAQINYPKDYFRLPLDIPMELSGCFGELRPNHFHSGFDIKTNKQVGLNIYAVADGYVSRIKISTYGYGKAIYVTHPNGFTSLYGHLSSGFGNIEKFIKKNQYEQKSYEIELFLQPEDLPVKKGEVIALSGNTGGSGGPHLHFEFRDSKNDNIINPMLFGFDKYLKDSKKPSVTTILAYPIDENSVINESNKPVTLNIVMQKDGSFMTQKIMASGKIGFGISAFDNFDDSFNKYGIYKASISTNEKSIFEYTFDSFAFEEFRYINALIDYPRSKAINQKVQQLFMKNPYPLKIIKTDNYNGITEITNSNMTRLFKIAVSDYENNTTEIIVPVDYSDLKAKNIEPIKKSKYFIKGNNENIFALENVEILFPENSFYNDFFMDLKVKNDTVFLHNESVPVHSNFTLSIDSKKYSEAEISKIFIGKLSNKKIEYVNTTRKGTVFTAKNRELGVYCLAKDSVAPKIVALKPMQDCDLSKEKNIQFKISDDLSGIKSFNGYINNNWVLLEYEYKLKRLTYNLSDLKLINGKNNFKLEVTDNVGNSSIFETSFDFNQE